MSIVKMQHLELVGLASEKDEILNRLMAAGCVELTTEEPEDAEQLKELLVQDDSKAAVFQNENRRFSEAITLLDKYAAEKTPLFADYRAVKEKELFNDESLKRAQDQAEEIIDLAAEVDEIQARKNSINQRIASLKPWTSVDIPLEKNSTRTADITYCTFPVATKEEALERALEEAAPLSEIVVIGHDKEYKYCALITHKSETQNAVSAIAASGMNVISFGEGEGTPSGRIEAAEAEIVSLDEAEKAVREKLSGKKSERITLQNAVDRSASEEGRELVKDRLVNIGSVFTLTGWAPRASAPALSEMFDKLNVAYEFREPKKEEEPPVLLKNNRLTRPLNMVTNMYSLPVYNNVDPNPLILPFFIVFFGIMYADLGYGLVLLVAGIVVGRMVKKPGTFKNMTGLLVMCGITTAIFGTLFGSCFGDAMNYIPALKVLQRLPFWAIKDATQDPMWFMYGSLILGIIHLITGMVIHLVVEIRNRNPLDGIFDVVPWWIVFAGIAMLVLGKGPVVLIIGIISLIATQGRHKKGIVMKILGGLVSIYDITNWLGDILSYTRLMALMLASGVIAQVFNMLGSLPGNIIFFIVIFIFGHLFNMGINIIGTYVHAARLQYLEYFGKFFVDGGKKFEPLAYKTKYTKISD